MTHIAAGRERGEQSTDKKGNRQAKRSKKRVVICVRRTIARLAQTIVLGGLTLPILAGGGRRSCSFRCPVANFFPKALLRVPR